MRRTPDRQRSCSRKKGGGVRRLAAGLLLLTALSPGLGWAQGSSTIVGVAGGSAVGGLGPLSGAIAPIAGALLGGAVPLVVALESFPCTLCVGVRVQPKDDNEFLQQFRSGLRAFPGLNAELIVGSPIREGGTLRPEEQEQVLVVQLGALDISVNPRTREVSFGFLTGERSRLPILDAVPIGAPLVRTDNRLNVADIQNPGGPIRQSFR